MGRSKRKVRIGYILTAVIVGVGGVVGFVYLLFTGITGLGEALIRLSVPAQKEIYLDQAGGYTIFLETPGIVDQRALASYASVQGLVIQILSPMGASVPVKSCSMSQTYTLGGRHGLGLMEFAIDRPGTYKFDIGFAENQPDRALVLTISQGFMRRVLMVIFKSGGVLLGALMISGLLITAAFVLGRREPQDQPPGLAPPID